MTPPVYDVAITGFGPTGAVAAALLGRHGLRTFVCDRQREIYDKPRAIALDHEIMRVFQELGLADELAAFTEPFTDSLFYGVDGTLIKRMSTVPPPYPMGYTPSLVFTQPRLEEVLRRHVAALSCVTLALGQNLTGLQQTDEQVTLSLQGEDGTRSTVQARYLIACDGASSTVRGLAGMQLEDLGFDEPWLVVDVLLNGRGLARVPATSVQYCEPQRPCSYIIGPGNHRRWEISINEGEDPQLAAAGALDHACRCHPVAPGQLPLPRAGGRRLAQRPRLSGRRRCPPAATLPRAGHVPGHTRRGQSRLEAGGRAARRRAGCAAGQLRPRAQGPCHRTHPPDQAHRPAHRRTRPRCRART
jgi:2-polyprenyl-6-methoxyphenol hydroxylase-like FAD-dependent oxidoreductase